MSKIVGLIIALVAVLVSVGCGSDEPPWRGETTWKEHGRSEIKISADQFRTEFSLSAYDERANLTILCIYGSGIFVRLDGPAIPHPPLTVVRFTEDGDGRDRILRNDWTDNSDDGEFIVYSPDPKDFIHRLGKDHSFEIYSPYMRGHNYLYFDGMRGMTNHPAWETITRCQTP